MRSRPWIAGLALGGLLLAVGCSSEGQLKRVEDEVGDLKLEVFKLRSQMEEANRKADEERSAGAVARNQDRRFQADLQETMRQLQDATRVLGTRLGDPGAQRPQPPRAGKPGGPDLNASEDEKAFNAALLDYNRGNYPLAAESLGLFLKSYPQSPRRPDALFTLGLCSFNQKIYDKARTTFEQILKEFANSPQFLPAKLKRAQCQDRMGMKPAAIKAYKELVEAFPGTPEARTAQQELADLGF
jgi:tol-pal system protein YbgF